MANEEPRTRRIVPSFPGSTEGVIDIWVRVFRRHARSKLCFNFISGVPFANRTVAERAEYRATFIARYAALLAGTISVPFEDDDKAERRQSTLLWSWTDPKKEWAAYMRCDDGARDIGTRMWTVITQRYLLRTATEVGYHRRQLQTKQRSEENIQDYWSGLTAFAAYMDAAGRHIIDLDLRDTVKDNALSIHASWTSLIDPQVTTRDQLEDLIYTRGVHLEQKLDEA